MISGSELGHYDEEASNDKRIGVDSANVDESKRGVVAIDDELGHYDEEAGNDKRIEVDSANVVESKHGVAIDDDLF